MKFLHNMNQRSNVRCNLRMRNEAMSADVNIMFYRSQVPDIEVDDFDVPLIVRCIEA